jgi:hypothetical protein
MPEPSTLDGRQAHEELCTLLEHAVVQQAKSSTSRRHEPEPDQLAQSAPREREAFVQPRTTKSEEQAPIHPWCQPWLPPSLGRTLQGPPQANATMGRHIRHRGSTLTWHLQTGHHRWQSLYQCLEYQTTTSLLPLDLQIVHMLNLERIKRALAE